MYNPEYEGVFESKIGYAQGGEDSPSGYIIFKDMFLSFLSSCPNLDAPKINGKVIPDNTYADDLRIYSTKFKGFGNGLNALEVFLSIFRGRLKATKSMWNAVLWDNNLNQIDSKATLRTSDGNIIPYKAYNEAVRDLGFKTSMDLANDSQITELQLKCDALATRTLELHQMSSCCAFLLDMAINVPTLAYACSFLPVTAENLSKLDKSNIIIIKGKFHLPPSFSNDLLHAFPLGMGRLGLFHRVLLDRWAILATHLTCPPDSLSHNIAIHLIDQLRLSAGLPSVANTAIGENLLPPVTAISGAERDLSLRWLYPLIHWLPDLDIGLIKCSDQVPSETLQQLLGQHTDIHKAQEILRKHQSDKFTIYSYSDGSYSPDSTLCAYATRLVLVEPHLANDNYKGRPIFSSSHCLSIPSESANAYIAEFLGLLTSLHVLSTLTAQCQFTHAITIEHRLDNSSVVSTSSSYQSKTPYQWLRIAGEPFWRCFYMVQSSFHSSCAPTIKWQRSHPERRNPDRVSWSIHDHHNYLVDQAANNALTRRGPRTTAFDPLSLCPGPVWCRRSTSDGPLIPILGPLRPTLRAVLGLKCLFRYLDGRHNASPLTFPMNSGNIHMPSIRCAWKRISVKLKARYIRIFSGWLPTATRISFYSNGAIPNNCKLCIKAHPNHAPAEDILHVLGGCSSLHTERQRGPQLILEYVLAILNNKTDNPALEIRPNQLLPAVLAYWNHLDETRAGVPLITTGQWIAPPISNNLTNRQTMPHILSLLFLGYLNFAWQLWLHRNKLLHQPAAGPAPPLHMPDPPILPVFGPLLPSANNPDITDHQAI